ncbi:hypothetical protein AB0L40_02175 [Patulibacter sp. NPDC049589]|uniref:hypothetical protein n=1 Tax=Patulibacter sp. NPDC049589 TaxID=3154731 RepID=UPI0034183FEE
MTRNSSVGARLLAVVAVVAFFTVAAGPAHAAPRLIVAPGGGALVTQEPVRVELTHRAGTKTRVRLGTRDVTSRFRVAGRRLVGRLKLGDGLRHGQNHLTVVATRGGKAEDRQTRSFFVMRRSRHFVRVQLQGTNPTRLQIDITSGASHASLSRRRRTLRVSLNGHSVTSALTARTGTRWAGTLSGTHGLRRGVNRIRVYVAEPRAGRYEVYSRRFTVRRDRPLAAAGADRATRPRVGVRLGGSHRAARGGRLSYRWTLVTKPAGSRSRISAPTSARPSLVPDRPGHYVARVRVDERGRGAAPGAHVRVGSSTDDIAVDVGPKASLVSLAANAFPVGPRGIQVGDPAEGGVFYPHTGPAATIQVLELDRHTLTPTNASTTWCCDDSPEHALESLKAKLVASTADDLVVVALPPQRATLPPSQYRAFNEVLDLIGVDPLDARDDLNKPGQQIVAVGVPSGGRGSGWVLRSHRANPQLARQGWLMPDGDLSAGYRFQPLRLPFDTSSASTATSNTMTFAGHDVTSPPLRTATGYHFVAVDPADLSVVRNLSFDNDAAGNAGLAQAIAAASELDDIGNRTGRGTYVALQSIGRFAPDNPGWDTASRTDSVATALAAIGANPHDFNYRSASYAFFGGAHLGAQGAAQSNAGIVADSTGPTYQSGKLSGAARMNPDGFFAPPTGPSTAAPVESLYDVVFDTKTVAYPYTTGPDVGEYTNAMKYISGQLSDPSVNRFGKDFTPDSGPRFDTDIRGAYVGLPDYAQWDDAAAALADKVHYPGRAAGACAGPPDAGDAPGFTLQQFCALKSQLGQEMVALVRTKSFTDKLKAAVLQASNGEAGILNTTYTTIKDAVDPPDGEIAAPILGLIRTLAEFADLAEVTFAPEVAVAVSLGADIIDLTSAVATSSSKPIGETLGDKASELGADLQADVEASAKGVDSIRVTAMSDWGRLQALDAAARRVASQSIDALDDQLENASGRYMASALMSSLKQGHYHAFRIKTDGSGRDGGPSPNDCRYRFRGAPDGAWVPMLYELDQWSSMVFAWDGNTSTDYPPNEILTQMFESPHLGAPIAKLGRGYGIDKTTWMWQQADADTTAYRQYDTCTFGE